MAKKTSAKKGTTKKVAKKATKKAAKKKSAKKPVKKSGPRKVSTGKGRTPAELGQILVDHVNGGGHDFDLWDAHFSRSFVSIEGTGDAGYGAKEMKARQAQFLENIEMHACVAEGLFVGATGFSVLFSYDMTFKDSGERQAGTEIGVYTVKNGKVVQEEFMYGPRSNSA